MPKNMRNRDKITARNPSTMSTADRHDQTATFTDDQQAIEDALASLRSSGRLRDNIVHWNRLPAQPASCITRAL